MNIFCRTPLLPLNHTFSEAYGAMVNLENRVSRSLLTVYTPKTDKFIALINYKEVGGEGISEIPSLSEQRLFL